MQQWQPWRGEQKHLNSPWQEPRCAIFLFPMQEDLLKLQAEVSGQTREEHPFGLETGADREE